MPLKDIKLTRKQKMFADALIKDPKKSGSEVVKQIYNVNTDNTARSIASENLTKPNILAYMVEKSTLAEQRIIQLMRSDNERIALDASKDILDRVHGKATQRIEQQSTSVKISIDLTSSDDTQAS